MSTNVEKPKGEFRRYIEWNGRWRHVYVISTFFQTRMFEPPAKMVEFKLTKSSKVTYSAEREHFFKDKPKTRKENSGIA